MEENNEIKKLFLSSGCISEEGFRLYLANRLDVDSCDLISSHTANCELCSSALEGFKILAEKKSPDEITTLLSDIKDKLDTRVIQEKESFLQKSTFDYKSAIIAIAASIVIIIGTYFLILLFTPEQNQHFAVTDKRHNPLPFEYEEQKPSLSTNQPSSPNTQQPGKKSLTITYLTHSLSYDNKTIMNISDSIDKISEITKNSLAVVDDIKSGLKDTTILEKNQNMSGNLAGYEDSKVVYEQQQLIPVKTEAKDEYRIIGTKSKKSMARQKTQVIDNVDGVFVNVDEMPSFPGGEDSLRKYINKNLHYPSRAKKKRLEGTVNVSFIVNIDGSILNINVLQGIGGGCNEETVRLIKSMPKWIPGKQSGMTVKVKINLPVNFSLKK